MGGVLHPARREINIYYPEFFILLLNIKKAVIVVEKSDEAVIIKKMFKDARESGRETI